MKKPLFSLICFFTVTLLSLSMEGQAQVPSNVKENLKAGETSTTEIPESEKKILLDIYNQLDGANWKSSKRWDITQSPSTWKGITIKDGHVTIIKLAYTGLKGQFPSSIAGLSELKELWLYGNKLTGNVPDALFTHQKLSKIVLDSQVEINSKRETIHTLTGTLPSKIDMPELTVLSVNSCGLTGELPKEIKAPKLQQVILSNNKFTGSISPEWFSLPQIMVFTAQDNGGLSGDIPDFSKAPKLLYLYLGTGGKGPGNPNLSGTLPKSFAGCPNLSQLEIQRTKVGGSIPKDINVLKNSLSVLALSGSQFEGVIPQEIAECTKLKQFAIGDNKIVGPLPDLSPLTNLQMLELSGNEGIGGTIPTWLPKLKKLTRIRMAKMGLTGSLPKELAPDGSGNGIQKLFLLDFSYNKLEGEVPAEWEALNKMTTLFLSHNKLSGNPIPLMLKLRQLRTIDISDNNFSGSIEKLFDRSSFESLSHCNVSHNHFSGSIVKEVYDIQKKEPFYGFFSGGANFSYNDFVFEDFSNFTDGLASDRAKDAAIYSPQNAYGEAKSYTCKEGEKITLDGTLKDVNNVGNIKPYSQKISAKYQWYLGGKRIKGATKPTYTIEKVDGSHIGVYVCKATHFLVPGLTLVSKEILISWPEGVLDITPGDVELRKEGDRLIYSSARHLYVYNIKGQLVTEGAGESVFVGQLNSAVYIVVVEKADGKKMAIKYLL